MVDSMIRMTTRKQNRVSDKRQARAAGPGCSAPQWELEVRTCFPLAPLRVMHMAVNIDQVKTAAVCAPTFTAADADARTVPLHSGSGVR